MNAPRHTVDEWFEEQFRQLQARPPSGVSVRRRVAVVSTPRCGSTLFCNSLASTGLFGHPAEWLNTRFIDAYARWTGSSSVHLGKYLNYVIERTTTPNGVFSLNFHVDQYDYWQQQGFDILSLKFDTVIYLLRRDKVSQAYSYAKALATDQWQADLAARRSVSAEDIGNIRIMRYLQKMVEWDTRFTREHGHQIAARFAYEDFSVDPALYRDALRLCEIDCPRDFRFESGLSILRNASDEARVAAFKAYLTGQGA